jgi:NAD(P)-dependent dehydrogenase (short-subunit alcohol dehydrogenase family)
MSFTQSQGAKKMDLSMFSLEGKSAIVTGASRGLGKTCALALADAGADVVCTSRDLEALRKTAKAVEAKGSKALTLVADILSEESIGNMVKQALDHFGKIDILVNNAGVAKVAPVQYLDSADWDLVLDTNLKGAFLVCKAILPEMKKRSYGRIINMSSLGGLRGTKNLSSYNASKAGLIKFSEALALEVAGYNITVNCICPGYILTDMNRQFFESEQGKMEIDKYPMKRLGDLSDIGGALIFLASDAASYVTATTVIIDGAQRWKGAL